MGVAAGGSKLPEPGGDTARSRALLTDIATATSRLVAALDAVGLNQRMRESPVCKLRALDRSLPGDTLDDLLLMCEALAMVTGPAALTTGDFARARTEAQRITRLLQTIGDAVRGRRRLSLIGTATGTQSAFLRSALTEPPVQDALNALIRSLAALIAEDDGEPQQRRRALPIGPGCVIPTAVMGGAVALIIVLLASIALATRQAPISPNGLNIPVISALPTATTAATATSRPASATPTSSRGSATATPRPVSSGQPPSGSPSLAVSPSTVASCPGSPASFTITYNGSGSPVSWSATVSDPSSVTLSPASGALSPGGSATVTVTVSDTATTGSITISNTGGLPSQTVRYDATGC